MTTKQKIKIDTLIISDLHLGDKFTRCDELLEVLRKYKFDKLILNGDVLNGLNFKRLHSEHWNVLSEFRKLSKYCEVIWTHGNHDDQASDIFNLIGIRTVRNYTWKSNDKTFLAFHGHIFDRFLNNNFIVSSAAFVIYNMIKKIDHLGWISNFVMNHNQTWQRNSREVAKGALRYAVLKQADFVFCGHTHQIYATEKWGVKYYNTGAWNEKESGYIIIADGEVNLISL